jgi:hypothetical protein
VTLPHLSDEQVAGDPTFLKMTCHPEWLTCLGQVKDGMNGAKRFAVFSVPITIAGCPISRSFFARCGIPRTFLLDSLPRSNLDRSNHPQICHPDRSEPGFPATRHSPTSTCAACFKESRMKFANATNINRKSGVA